MGSGEKNCGFVQLCFINFSLVVSYLPSAYKFISQLLSLSLSEGLIKHFYDRAMIVEKKVMDFKRVIKLMGENPNLKFSDPMLIDTAIWFIETTLNFTYADLTNIHASQYFDSSYIDVSLINGGMQIAEAINAYNRFADTLSSQYDDITDPNKFCNSRCLCC